ILARDLERLAHLESEGAFHYRAVTHSDAETESPSPHFLQSECLLGEEHGMARVDGKNTRAQTDTGGHVRIGGEDLKPVAPDPVGDPYTLVARSIGPACEIHRRREIGAGREEDRGAWHGVSAKARHRARPAARAGRAPYLSGIARPAYHPPARPLRWCRDRPRTRTHQAEGRAARRPKYRCRARAWPCRPRRSTRCRRRDRGCRSHPRGARAVTHRR